MTQAAADWLQQFERFEVSERAYLWSVRVFSFVQKMLGVQVHLHDPGALSERGDIFLFNHFSRFETFIPQYLLHRECGAITRAVASGEFFGEDDALGNYLGSVGAVANDTPGLLPFLAAEILRGRKLVMFPEGGMVKDRRVIDDRGEYGVFSRTAGERRKHHTGAAVLALILDAFKAEVRFAEVTGDYERLEEWALGLGFASADDLVSRARTPTLIVPANITFYPLRVDDNLLRRGAELFTSKLSRRATEELLVEGNLLLKDTDMDIRFAAPIETARHWGWWERKLMARIAHRFEHLEDFFTTTGDEGWQQRLLSSRVRERVLEIRNQYMSRMYSAVTVNICHLASTLIVALLDHGTLQLPRQRFAELLYRAIKLLQDEPELNLHRSVDDPFEYRDLLIGATPALDQFFCSAESAELVRLDGEQLFLLPKLHDEHTFDEIRLENFVLVYANEVAPIHVVAEIAERVVAQSTEQHDHALARALFDDELRVWQKRRVQYTADDYAEINGRETATESGKPFLMIPGAPARHQREVGVVLVHGFLASPAEMRALAMHLYEQGYVVLGVRLAGHGTSPCDLDDRYMDDWLRSVARGEALLGGLVRRFVTIGFSTGGALTLIRASTPDPKRVGIVAINVPVRFVDPRMKWVPLLATANAIVERISSSDGVVPYRPNDSAHPEVNYASIPVNGLKQLILTAERVLEPSPQLDTPLQLIQADNDPVVDAHGVELLRDAYQNTQPRVSMLNADRHDIIYDNDSGCWDVIDMFLADLALDPLARVQP
jgi:esterase/lipase